MVLSTGSPLAPIQFDYVYDYISKNVLLGSITGTSQSPSFPLSGVPNLSLKKINRRDRHMLPLLRDEHPPARLPR